MVFGQSKTRGAIGNKKNKNTDLGKNYILTIGIDSYANWNILENAVNDAKGVNDLFTTKLGYQQISKPLINNDATKSSIMSLLENDLPKLLTNKDNLVIFFAGHGDSFQREIGTKSVEIGYIIPQDASHPSKNNFNSYIKADELMSKINELPAKHILLILDACKSGIAINSQKWRDNSYTQDLRNRMSRKVITSAMSDQVASDNGPIKNHSLFTGTLINGFNTGMIDKSDRNGIVTSSEIGLYLQQLVAQNSNATVKQTPDFGAFGYDDRGEMVIDLNDESSFSLKSKLNGSLLIGDLMNAWKNLDILKERYPEDPEIDYFEFRRHLYQLKTDKALESIDRLQPFIDNRDDKYYLSSTNVWDLKRQLPYWKNILEVEKKNDSIVIKVEIFPNIVHKDYSISDTGEPLEVKINKDDNLEIKSYHITPKSSFQIEIENTSSDHLFLYVFYFDFNGSFQVVSFFEDYDISDFGLAPGKKTKSLFFTQDGAIGLERISIYSSKSRIRKLDRPMNTISRGNYNSVDIEELDLFKNDVFLLFKL